MLRLKGTGELDKYGMFMYTANTVIKFS